MSEDKKIDTNFQTPIAVAKYMISLIPVGAKSVLEPTPGIGNIVSLLNGFNVTAPDDFFLLQKRRFDCIIMNPPFSSKYAFLENAPPEILNSHPGMKLGYWILLQCMMMSNNIIALMPHFTISDSDVRLRRIMSFGLKSLTLLPRSTFKYTRIQTCIFHLVKGYCGKTELRSFEVYKSIDQPELYGQE